MYTSVAFYNQEDDMAGLTRGIVHYLNNFVYNLFATQDEKSYMSTFPGSLLANQNHATVYIVMGSCVQNTELIILLFIYFFLLGFSADSDSTDGDLDELVDELNEGKMLYAAIKVMDPNTNLPKIVFINWVGHLCKL